MLGPRLASKSLQHRSQERSEQLLQPSSCWMVLSNTFFHDQLLQESPTDAKGRPENSREPSWSLSGAMLNHCGHILEPFQPMLGASLIPTTPHVAVVLVTYMLPAAPPCLVLAFASRDFWVGGCPRFRLQLSAPTAVALHPLTLGPSFLHRLSTAGSAREVARQPLTVLVRELAVRGHQDGHAEIQIASGSRVTPVRHSLGCLMRSRQMNSLYGAERSLSSFVFSVVLLTIGILIHQAASLSDSTAIRLDLLTAALLQQRGSHSPEGLLSRPCAVQSRNIADYFSAPLSYLPAVHAARKKASNTEAASIYDLRIASSQRTHVSGSFAQLRERV